MRWTWNCHLSSSIGRTPRAYSSLGSSQNLIDHAQRLAVARGLGVLDRGALQVGDGALPAQTGKSAVFVDLLDRVAFAGPARL